MQINDLRGPKRSRPFRLGFVSFRRGFVWLRFISLRTRQCGAPESARSSRASGLARLRLDAGDVVRHREGVRRAAVESGLAGGNESATNSRRRRSYRRALAIDGRIALHSRAPHSGVTPQATATRDLL
jgi:hypothetical protein